MVEKKAKKKIKKEVKPKMKFNPGTQKYEPELSVVEKKVTKKLKEKETRQLIWFFVVVVLVFAGFLGTYFYVQSLNKFEYAGIQFGKIKQGELDLYHGRFPIVYKGVLQNYYNFWLRNDPRKNDVMINSVLSVKQNVILSLEPEAGNCYGAIIAQMELGKFLSVFPWVEDVGGAVNDEETANAMNITYATCENARNNQTVFIIQKSETASIEKGDADNCYIINVGDCENIKTAERFIVGVIAQINEIEI